jgi:multiple sugar transport system substrate-binding protein
MPYMRSTEALYINKDLVEKLGYEVPDVLTWDFIWEVSEKAIEKDEDGTFRVNGQKVMIPFIYKSTDNMMISMLKQLNAPYSTDAGEILIFNDTTKSLLEEIYDHGKSRAFSTFAISSYPGNFLNAGQCIFAIDSTAGATWMGCNAPLMDIPEENVVQFETVVRPIPQFHPEEPKMISQGPSVCVFSKANSQEVLASWLFVQYLLTNGIQMGYAETEGYLPVTLKAQNSAEYQDYLSRKGEDNKDHYNIKIEASELLLKHTADTFVTPVFNGSASLRSAAGQLIENTVKGARRKQEMNDEFIRKLYAEVESLYRLDQIGKVTAETREAGETDNKPLPTESVVLLAIIPCIWIVIGAFKLWEKKKARSGK